jgi:DNA repair protein RadC
MRNCIFSVRAMDAAITLMNSRTRNLPKTSDSPEQQHDDLCIQEALKVLEKRMSKGPWFTSTRVAKEYLRLKLARHEYEMFGVLWLNAKMSLITFNEMFRGTITASMTYPRELVRDAIKFNAAACILSHNHPSGDCQPSGDDKAMTLTLKNALAVIDVRVVDHIIVGAGSAYSMAEQGELNWRAESYQGMECAVKTYR